MAGKLATIALFGFGIAIACAAVAISLGGPGRTFLRRDLLGKNFDLSFLNGGDCAAMSADTSTITRDLPWTTNSDKIELDLPAIVTWAPGSGDEVIASGPPALVERVRIDGDRVTTDCDSTDDQRLTIKLPGRAFSHYQIDAVSQLRLAGLNQPELNLDIDGAAIVDAAGVVPDTDLHVSGAASINLNNLITQDLHADLSGASNVVANPAQTADIDISGLGQVTLLSRPKNYHADISGLGHVSVPDQPGSYE